MVSKPVAHLLADLSVTKTHNRPHVSNDNPYPEAQFKTLKYQPTFSKCCGCHEDALAFCRRFFQWYNEDHYHTGLGLLTPASVHYATARRRRRACVIRRSWRRTTSILNGSSLPPSSKGGGQSVIAPATCLKPLDTFRRAVARACTSVRIPLMPTTHPGASARAAWALPGDIPSWVMPLAP